jgi:thermitase
MTQTRVAKTGISFATIRDLGILGVLSLSLSSATLRAEQPVTSAPEGPRVVPGRILLRPNARASELALQGTFERLGAKQEGKISQINVRILNVPDQAQERVLEALRNNPNVEFADPDFILQPSATPNDPYFSQAWHLSKISAPSAWDTTVGSSAVTIAVLDSGCTTSHPDLAGLIVPGWNFYNNNSDLTDISGHGTAVAGTAAALANNGQGVAGVTWNCRLMPLRITDASGYGYSSAIASALTWAADHGARVANISYGNVTKITTIISAAQYFQSKGGVITAAAGNETTFDSTADNPYFLLVSATDPNDVLCSWSNTGNNVDLAAPGYNIVSTYYDGVSYSWCSGTSFSAPIVAGVAALVLSVNPSLSGTKVQDILRQNADDLGAKGWDTSYGWGRVNAARAVAAAGGQPPPADTTPPSAAVTAPTSTAILTGTVSVSVSASDNVGVTKIEWYLDGALKASSATASASFSWNTTTGANGSHTLAAKAYDSAGNVGSSANVSVNVNNPIPDSTAPAVSITSPINNSNVAGIISVTLSGADNVAVTKVEWYLDGTLKASSATASASFNWNSATVANGLHTIAAKAYDAAGNVGTSSALSVNVNNPVPDNVAPDTIVSSPTSGSTLTGNVDITISASDNVGVTRVEWYLDGVLQGSNLGAVGSFSWNTTAAVNGNHNLSAKAYDAAGNIGLSAALAVNVDNPLPDTAVPSVAINSLPPASVVSETVTVSLSAADNVSVTKVEWYLDGTLSDSSTSSSASFWWDTTTTANGAHTLFAKAYDAAGNVGTSGDVTVTVDNFVPDTTAPVGTISSPANGATVSGIVNVAFGGSDNIGVATVELYVDGSLAMRTGSAAGSFSWDTSTAANGAHTLQARAYDVAGNIGTSAILSVNVNNIAPDTTAPSVQITSPSSGTKVSRNVKVTVAANDNTGVASIELYIDGKLYQSVAGSTASFTWNTAKVSVGAHTLQAYAFDAAGNKGTSVIVTVSK